MNTRSTTIKGQLKLAQEHEKTVTRMDSCRALVQTIRYALVKFGTTERRRLSLSDATRYAENAWSMVTDADFGPRHHEEVMSWASQAVEGLRRAAERS